MTSSLLYPYSNIVIHTFFICSFDCRMGPTKGRLRLVHAFDIISLAFSKI